MGKSNTDIKKVGAERVRLLVLINKKYPNLLEALKESSPPCAK